MENLVIHGGKTLNGTVSVGGSKNAVLPIMAATLLTTEKTILTNVPDISDVHKFCEVIEFLGGKTNYEAGTLTIEPEGITEFKELPKEPVCRMRASILFAGAMLARFDEADMPYPGGCVLGKRSMSSHVLGFKRMGVKELDVTTKFHMKRDGDHNEIVILPEFSVTATENVLILAALKPKTTQIRIAACEPHVQDLCHFLVKMGAEIEGIGTHTLTVHGKAKLNGTEHRIVSDYLQAGTYLLAGVITKGEVKVTDIDPEHLDIFFEKFEELGVKFERGEDWAKVYPSENLKPLEKLKTGIHPNFPTDLQAPFTILLTQCNGVSKVFETMFESRFQYLFEIEKMRARIELLNPHQAIIIGPTQLRGATVASCDIRAGAAVVLAALAAEGESIITDIQYIDRGYENFESNLTSLGADIKRVKRIA